MSFHLIDLNNWARKPYYDYYMNLMPCRYNITSNLNVESFYKELKRRGLKFYPAFLYVLSRALNQQSLELRMAHDQQGSLGYWDTLIPSYAIFHNDDHTFGELWTDYNEDFAIFYQNAFSDMETYKSVKKIKAKPERPANFFRFIPIPWISFTSYNIDATRKSDDLIPTFITGKFFEQNGDRMMPFCVYIHHAVADGYHTGKLINDLQGLMDNYADWMNFSL